MLPFIGMATLTRWLPSPYMVKTFKNPLLQNQKRSGAHSLHKSYGTGGLLKLLKWLSYIDIWPFYGKVKFASSCICMDPSHYMGKYWQSLFFWTSPLQIMIQLIWNLMRIVDTKLLKLSWKKIQNGHHSPSLENQFSTYLHKTLFDLNRNLLSSSRTTSGSKWAKIVSVGYLR